MVQLAAIAGARTTVAAFPAVHGILMQDLASLVQLPGGSVACLATAAATTTTLAPTDSLGPQQQKAAASPDTQSATTGHVDGATDDDNMVSGNIVIHASCQSLSLRSSALLYILAICSDTTGSLKNWI